MNIPVSPRQPEGGPNSLLSKIPSIEDEPLDMLVACHGRVRAFTETLRKLARHLRQNGADAEAATAATNILRYFDLAAPRHHQDEEDDLFPLLLTCAPDDALLARQIAALKSDHLQMGEPWLQVRERLLLVRDGGLADLLSDGLADRFADLYQAHAGREEQTVFPRAAELLDAARLQWLGQRMSARRRDA